MQVGEKIKELRLKKALSLEELANRANIRLATAIAVERGQNSPRMITIRKIAQALDVEPEALTSGSIKLFLREKEQTAPVISSENRTSGNSDILQYTANPNHRVADYKQIFMEASGNIFISGTSMISLSEDSANLIMEKIQQGTQIRLLILNPEWIRENYFLLSFLPNDAARKNFHFEVQNSIGKLQAIHESLPDESRNLLSLNSYRTFFPYIVTGFCNGDLGKCVVEITDYLPERERPRFTLAATGTDTDGFFHMVFQKFNSLWDSPLSQVVF